MEKLIIGGLEKLGRSERHDPPLTKAIDDTNGLFELRVGKANIARVFFFFQSGQEIIITNGYVKKRQELDQGKLHRAALQG
ncbi:MAG TPA: type II toxin-antitoxin system RelE/ParE family toxin [Thermomicrobiales bacterium]